MKNFLFVLFLFSFFISCSGTQTVARDEAILVTGYDFTKYTDKGFLFTPEEFQGNYQSMGLITVTLWPKVVKRKVVVKKPAGDGKFKQEVVEKFIQEGINVEKAIEETYQVANKMGADAITRFDVTPTSRMNGTLRVHGVEISGFAIKRE